MKPPHIVWSIAIASALSYSVYTHLSEIPSSSDTNMVSRHVQEKVNSVAQNSSLSLSSQTRASSSYLSGDALLQAVSSMPWASQYYDSYMKSGGFDIERYVKNVEEIEELLRKSPWLINRIEGELWWQKYLAGELSPEYILLVEMRSFLTIDQFAIDEPEIYAGILKYSPRWLAEWGESAYARKTILDQALLYIAMIEDNSSVSGRIKDFGYTYEDIYRVASMEQWNFYEILDAIKWLEDPNMVYPEVREQFFASDTGKAYLAWKISPLSASKYMNELMIKYTENMQ